MVENDEKQRNERATRERSVAIDGNYSDDNIIITLYTESIIISSSIITPPSTRKGSRGSKDVASITSDSRKSDQIMSRLNWLKLCYWIVLNKKSKDIKEHNFSAN